MMLMPKKVFKELKYADVRTTWTLFGDEIVKRFTGQNELIPIPDFDTINYPCAPGMIILSQKNRSFREFFRRSPPRRIFSEFLWDFHPQNSEARILRTENIEENDDLVFTFRCSRTSKGKTKTLSVVFWGRHINELSYEPEEIINSKVENDLLDRTSFNCQEMLMIERVYSTNMGRIEVWVDDDVDVKYIYSREAVGFSVCSLSVGGDMLARFVKKISPVNHRSLTARWVNRKHYKVIFHVLIPNQRKYGGEAGDVLGPCNNPFNLRRRTMLGNLRL